jgi:hypothetical protein
MARFRTMARAAAFAVLGVAGGQAAGCQLVADTSLMDDGACPKNQKVCSINGRQECVATDDPSYGCGDPSCQHCEVLGGTDFHATAVCTRTARCSVSACHKGYQSCDVNPDDCETNVLVSNDHCGQCNRRCANPVSHGTVACIRGACTLKGGCEPGYADCDLDLANGCECDTRTGTSPTGACACGACSNMCSSGQSCSDGGCR